MFNGNYLAEKASFAERGAKEILNALKHDQPNSPSYVIDGILKIEDALGSLHVGARQMLEVQKATEKDYMLRNMGMVIKEGGLMKIPQLEGFTGAVKRLIDDLDDAKELVNEEGEMYTSVAETILCLKEFGVECSDELIKLAQARIDQ